MDLSASRAYQIFSLTGSSGGTRIEWYSEVLNRRNVGYLSSLQPAWYTRLSFDHISLSTETSKTRDNMENTIFRYKLFKVVAAILMVCAVPHAHACLQREALDRSLCVCRCAVRDLPPEEEYPQDEIDNRKSQKNSAIYELLASAITAVAGFAATNPAGIAGAVAAVGAGKKIEEAGQDISKMERHNAAARQQQARRDQQERTREQRLMNH